MSFVLSPIIIDAFQMEEDSLCYSWFAPLALLKRQLRIQNRLKLRSAEQHAGFSVPASWCLRVEKPLLW